MSPPKDYHAVDTDENETTKKDPAPIVTTELKIHIAIVSALMLAMLVTIVRFSSPTRPEFNTYKHLLSPSWISPSLWIDNSDQQYATFRGNLKLLIPLMILHVSVSNAIQRSFVDSYRPRIAFSLAFSILFFAIYNGFSGLLKLGIVLGVNYVGAIMLRGSKLAPVWAWSYGLFVLIATNYYRGFQFGWISPHLSFLDAFPGLNSGWFDPLRFCFLRMVSFNMDFYWKCRLSDSPNDTARSFDAKKHLETCKECTTTPPKPNHCAKSRIETPLPLPSYNPLTYTTYLLYIPLYLAGPILTFNDFVHQFKTRPTTTLHLRPLLLYTLRWITCLLLMEIFIHSTFVIAIARAGAWKRFSVMEVACWGYIYIPMGGNKMYVVNLLVTFTFVAMWHDLSMNLLLWGWLISLSIVPETLAMRLFPHKRLAGWRHYNHVCGVGAVANILLMIACNIIGFGAASSGKSVGGGGVGV
ncbi:glycerol transporter, partial [Podochytrium sp. JEL0797]